MYTNKSKISNYLMIDINASFDSQINNWISGIEAYINNYCGCEFETESASNKLYDGNGTREILIDELLTLTKIEILDEDGNVDYTLDNDDYYWLYPANDTPKKRIVINSANAPIGWFSKGNQNVKITGNFGYSSSVPTDIELIATKLVAGIIGEKNLDIAGEIKSEKLGEYAVSMQDISKMANHLEIIEVMNKYRKIEV